MHDVLDCIGQTASMCRVWKKNSIAIWGRNEKRFRKTYKEDEMSESGLLTQQLQ